MTSATPRPCPQCQQLFQPSRRNQRYCSPQCRVDANNDQAQKKYTDYRQHATQSETDKFRLGELQAFMRRQIVIAQEIEEVTLTKILWSGKFYHRHQEAMFEPRDYGIYLYPGGGLYLAATDEVIYRRVYDKDVKEPFLYKREIRKL